MLGVARPKAAPAAVHNNQCPFASSASTCYRRSSVRQRPVCRGTKDGTAEADTHASRRHALLLATAAFAARPAPAVAESSPSTSYGEVYRDERKGYRLSPPPGWKQGSKAGADVLFEAPDAKGTNLGVTVTPVRIKSLEQFGSVDAVGKKLLNVEKEKESTLSVSMLNQGQRAGQSGTTTYDFDYIIESTRGTKRILSTVAISRQRLYIVNGNIKCSSPQCDNTADIVAALQQSLDSFVDV